MLSRLLATTRALLPVLSLSVGTAQAGQVWIVDVSNGPGTHFTQIAAGLAVVPPGDVLYVRPGAYQQFDLVSGVAVVAESTFSVADARIAAIPSGQVAVVAGMQALHSLQISGCIGTVILARSQVYGTKSIESCDDVRISSLASSGEPLVCETSRLELVDSTLVGGCCYSYGWSLPPIHGWTALQVSLSRLHGVALQATGGGGLNYSQGAGDGGHGLLVLSSYAILVGGTYQGGNGGYGGMSYHCYFSDGAAGNGIYSGQSSVSLTDVTAMGGFQSNNYLCAYVQAPGFKGSGYTRATPPNPSLRLLGDPKPGATVSFEVKTEPGFEAGLMLGSAPAVVAEPGVEVEILTTVHTSIKLGFAPSGGRILFPFKIKTALAPGLAFLVQAEVVDPATSKHARSNSVPVVVH